MIVFAIIATVIACGWGLLVLFANGMRSSPGKSDGWGTVAAGFSVAAVFWLAWWVG